MENGADEPYYHSVVSFGTAIAGEHFVKEGNYQSTGLTLQTELMKETIIVLGGDGYYGWPIALKLAVTRPRTKILIVDNEWRRSTVRRIGSDSLLPVARLPKRVAAFREIYGQDNLHYLFMDVNSDALEQLIREEQPHTIYHMAQQCSAPYSMLGLNESLYTIQNNEGNNMRLLWAVRKHVPDAHIIKMGSMGEYANGGIDIAEGYFHPEFNGKKAVKPMPFPRQSDDVYHISKINDSNYVSMACRKWGLRITEVMQSTLFGVYIDEMLDCEDLFTRFDYDDIFGTVVNRFLTQAVAGHPLTVYGKGNQTTGIMPMKDAVNSLELIAGTIPEPGSHVVVNHVTKANSTINELASGVKELAEKLGYEVTVNHVFDPRSESDAVKHDIRVMTGHIDSNVCVTSIQDVLEETLGIIAKHKNRINSNVFTHHIHAFRGEFSENAEADALEDVTNETAWSSFFESHFSTSRVNLNPGTLGTVSTDVKKVRRDAAVTGAVEGNPLAMYDFGRKKLTEIKSLCNEIWPSKGYELVVANGTSQTINLLALSMIRAYGSNGAPLRVITSTHEHPGGIGVFENLPEYKVFYLDDAVLNNPRKFRKVVKEIQPQVAFLSQVYYSNANTSAFNTFSRITRREVPGCRIILDVTQAIGLYSLPFGIADVLIGSAHKWLFGPHGSGLTWIKKEFHQWIQGLFWNGMGIAAGAQQEGLSLQGGQDFVMYAELAEALKLYRQVGKDRVQQRSAYLATYFREKLEDVLQRSGIRYRILNTNPEAPMLAFGFPEFHPFALYSELNDNGVHCKCIIGNEQDGETVNILRFGLPYFETIDRLERAAEVVEEVLRRQQKVVPLENKTVEAAPEKKASVLSVAA
ncbi:MAG TPA: aminotransferase class V-fold PLP-dependent enzyme [Chitinophagaceae bacterium]